MSTLCTLWFKTEHDVDGTIHSRSRLEKQVKKESSNMNFSSASLGATVWPPVPDVDVEWGDSRDLLAIIISVTEDDFYRLRTFERILNQLHPR